MTPKALQSNGERTGTGLGRDWKKPARVGSFSSPDTCMSSFILGSLNPDPFFL